MDIHEYQAKGLLKANGMPVPLGIVARTPREALMAVETLNTRPVVVKAQVHAGGRGEAGGVAVCENCDAAADMAERLIGSRLVTRQTGPEGKLVEAVYVEEATAIARELYLALLYDRASQRIMLMASKEGGMDIEELAETAPGKIIRQVIDPAVGMASFVARRISFALDLDGAQTRQMVGVLQAAYKTFRASDAELLEINPLAVTDAGDLIALDTKMSFDGNALMRQPGIAALRDRSQEDPREAMAGDMGLAYVGLEGNIGCIINGAGLAMATMDMIQIAGGTPANFLDIGGGASPERVGNAFRAVLADGNVDVLLVNIFAGINRCDWIAEGVIEAYKAQGLTLPVIVRLSGTNVEEGRAMIAASGLPLITADTLAEAAEKAVTAADAA